MYEPGPPVLAAGINVNIAIAPIIGYSQTPIALRFAVIRTAGYP
jgi:hypothetical protein